MFPRSLRIPGPAVLASLCALAALSSSASATAAGGASGDGGAGTAPRPGPVTCRTACAALDAPRPGSRVRVSGEDLQDVTALRFLGAPGAQDDVDAPAADARAGTVEAVVPPTAAPGPVAVLAGGTARTAARTLRLGAPAVPAPQTAVAARTVVVGLFVFLLLSFCSIM